MVFILGHRLNQPLSPCLLFLCASISVLKHNVMSFGPLKIDVTRAHGDRAVQLLLSCKGTLKPTMVKGLGQGCTDIGWQSCSGLSNLLCFPSPHMLVQEKLG